MKKAIATLAAFMFVIICTALNAGEIKSLSHLFSLGHGLADSDGDGLADALAFHIVIPDQPTAQEAAAAADIAGRANLESLVADFDLVMTESRFLREKKTESVILIGPRLRAVQDLFLKDKSLASLGAQEGAVTCFNQAGLEGLALVAGSDETLLKTARAFFLRWPYFWEIWGREDGSTYFSLEKDLGRFLEQEGLSPAAVSIKRARYEFPSRETPHESLKRLLFQTGQVKNLEVEIAVAAGDGLDKAFKALAGLAEDRARGRRTEILSYPGCGLLTFHILRGPESLTATLPRTGFPKRLLTPGYKPAARPESKGKEFDLLGLFTAKALLADSDQDGLADNVETSIVISRDSAVVSLSDLTTRLTLSSAGASFPLVYLDKEIDNPKSLTAPVLIGDNSLSRELQKTGKLKPAGMAPGQGQAAIVPAAFHKSSALALSGADAPGLESLLRYLGRTFPYLTEYGKGNPQLADILSDVEKFIGGERGAAEAYFHIQLKKLIDELRGKDLESFQAELVLPGENPEFVKEAEALIRSGLNPKKLVLNASAAQSGKVVLEKTRDFSWEADDALGLLVEKIKGLNRVPKTVTIEAGLSESPPTRQSLKARFERAAAELGIPHVEARVFSAYKQGFFWLREEVLPELKGKNPARILIRWAKENDDYGRMKRFYSEPTRWLQELYPIDELLAEALGLPLDRIEFEAMDGPAPVYRVSAYDPQGANILERDFSPRLREMPYLPILPEWGTVKVSTGWLKLAADGRAVLDAPLECDLEKFWNFYKEEVLAPVYSTILKKTDHNPLFSKQPFFKKLTVELWASEPDFRLGLDEERISSLEAMHDELYFDTLDFLRGITDLDRTEDTPEDTSRFSAPGNVMPIIHPSSEGRPPRVKVTFEDNRAPAPQLEVRWMETGREEISRTLAFPAIKPKALSLPALVYSGRDGRVESLTALLELDKEEAYTQLIDIVQACRERVARGLTARAMRFPGLGSLVLRLKFKDLEKEERLPILPPLTQGPPAAAPPTAGRPTIPEGILSPDMVWEAVRRLDGSGPVRAYTAGRSYEGRPVPVLEVHTPAARYLSIPRLATFKPTLYLSGRQHANEVSSTSYILMLADRLAHDPAYADYPKKINFVLHPLENPDGASLAYDLQKLTPDHSLHAGRYSALGLEIGYQTDAAKPLLPEAQVRRDINAEWLPDIYLNLHGYPSHEWVQAFSNYSPFLFREYWIPKGWFAYYRAVTNPYYRQWQEAGQALERTIIRDMQARAGLRESNAKFYNRYFRWATRWQPHLNELELHDGLNLIQKRRSSQETKPDNRTRITYIEETPELMDETAQGGWLRFLTEQGLTYLLAHIKYLSQARFDILRLEEEVSDRVRIQFFRSRPGVSPSREQ